MAEGPFLDPFNPGGINVEGPMSVFPQGTEGEAGPEPPGPPIDRPASSVSISLGVGL